MAMGVERLILLSKKILVKNIEYVGVVSYVKNDVNRILGVLNYLRENSYKFLAAPMHISVDKQFRFLDDNNIVKAVLIYEDICYMKDLRTGEKIELNII